MLHVPPYPAFVPYVAALLGYLAGLVVAIILLIRARGTAAILAVVGFALLTLVSIGQIGLALPAVGRQIARVGPLSLGWPLHCCCGIFDLAAIVCLIVALWQALSGQTVEEAETPTLEEEPATEEPA